MIINLTAKAADAMLDSLAGMMDGGSVELLTNSGKTLAVLKLSNPAGKAAAGGELELNRIAEEDAALAQGAATSARIFAADGSEVFACDVGDENSDAVIKLSHTMIYRNDPVQLHSFRLVMPSGG